jgi:DNA-binding NarL/FixJ family response regulator
VTRVAIVAAAAAVRGRLEAIVRSSASLGVSAVASSVEELGAAPDLASSEVALLHASAEVGAREVDAMPPIPLVVLVSSRVPQAAIAAMLRAGARGVLPDDATGDEIAAAIDAAAAGLVVVPPELVSDLVGVPAERSDGAGLAGAPARPAPAAPALTPREREVLSMLAEGLPNKLIAARLGISEHTVKTHLEAIFDKLGASTRAEAVARGVRRGLLLL